MTNAKSRLVRIIALALAVLMIVPMALVGCNKNTGVDQAALDAALKEALDAAQKAQDAADKAAQDAKDAQDKLDAAEKEAADLQAQIDAMKNTTTAAPATTTQAPVSEDAKVVDAYIASIVLDKESDYNKLVKLYKALSAAYFGATTNPVSADAKAIFDAIDTAEIAIRRAPTVDYVNHLVAQLAADLDAIPTFSERVKEAYDAIDFASDEDIVDVAYANALLKAAAIPAATTGVDEIDEFFAAEKKALGAFGEEKLDLTKLITDEYARYADANDGLYADAFGYDNDDLVAKIQALFSNNAELDVEEIVYGEAANEDAIEAIEDLYDEFYKLYKKDYAALQEAFEIAVIGEDYLLKAEGNFLREKLAAAKERVAELEAAVEEYNATKIFTNSKTGIAAIAKAYADNYGKTTETPFLFNEKTNAKIVAIDEALAAWMAKYSFDAEDDNLNEIIGDGVYATFVEVKAVMNFVNEWAAKLDSIKASDIDAAIDALKDEDKRIDYAEQGAAVKALYAWYYGTYKVVKEKNGEGKLVDVIKSNEDGVLAAELELADSEDPIKIDTANIADMLDDALEVKVDQVKALAAALEVFEGVKLLGKDAEGNDAILAEVKAIDKKADKLDLDALKTEDITAMAEIIKALKALCEKLGFEKDEDAEFGYATDSKNYGVVPFDTWAAINGAKDALVGDLLDKAAEIVKAYIGWAGEYDEDEEAVIFPVDKDGKPTADSKYYDVDEVEISAFSYALISTLAADYNAISIFEKELDDEKIVIEDIEEEEVEFTTKQVVAYYRAMNDEFYYNIMDKIHGVAYGEVRVSTIINNDIGGSSNPANEWMHYNTLKKDGTLEISGVDKTAYDTLVKYEAAYGEFGLTYVFPTNSSTKGTGNAINVYATVDGKGSNSKQYINAVAAVDATKYAVKNADGIVIDFDAAAYKAAVDASVASFRATWYADYLTKSANATTINALYDAVIENAIKFKLWTIEGEFEMNDEAYTFVVNADKSVTVKDDADEVVATVKDAKEAEYTITAALENNKIVIKATIIGVVDDPATEDVNEAKDAVKNLADVDDAISADAPKYEYTLADGKDEIIASCTAIGTVKKANDKANSYILYNEKFITALVEAFETNDFYVFRDKAVADAKSYANGTGDYASSNTGVKVGKEAADAEGDTLITNLYSEFSGAWTSVKHDKATKAEIVKALDAFKAQVDKIAPPVEVAPEAGVEA